MTSNPWPSSDWVTFVSERGFPALALLGLTMLSLLIYGMRALRVEETAEGRFGAAVFLSTLVVLVTVGAFDAVLLLPVPALIGWCLLGALAPPARERVGVDIGVLSRIGLIAGMLVLGVAASVRSGTQLAAMAVYSSSGRLSSLERASALDPGSFRIRLRLADSYIRRGDCAKARPHANAAKTLFPMAPSARRAAAACGR